MPEGFQYSCEGGQCTWRWDANSYPADELTLRVRHQSGDMELRRVPNTGELVLPDDQEVEGIASPGEGGAERGVRWRGPG